MYVMKFSACGWTDKAGERRGSGYREPSSPYLVLTIHQGGDQLTMGAGVERLHYQQHSFSFRWILRGSCPLIFYWSYPGDFSISSLTSDCRDTSCLPYLPTKAVVFNRQSHLHSHELIRDSEAPPRKGSSSH